MIPRLLACLLFIAYAAAQAAAPPPNILFCIADDWSHGHAGACGDPVVKTPHFDRIAREGALFTHAFCASPSCTPSRAALLTGRAVHQLGEGGNLWSALPRHFATYPDLLAAAGYRAGAEGKGWAPGNLPASERTTNPAGPRAASFEEFLAGTPASQPFCFWYGSTDPHRPYAPGSGAAAGLDPASVRVPGFWPDTGVVRSDMVDYYAEVQRFDTRLGELLTVLEKADRLADTLVIVTSDNGMPFPRAKANLYDHGARIPLAMRWPARIPAGTRTEAFVSLIAIAPTVLDAAGLSPVADSPERSLLPLLEGNEPPALRDRVYLERERHANVRRGDLSYPARAVRTAHWLYIRNFRPDRWPAGDPVMHAAVGEYGDADGGPTKTAVMALEQDPVGMAKFQLCFGKRPAEELYDIKADPDQIQNLAGQPAHAATQTELNASLLSWMTKTGDPRATTDDDRWDLFPYYGKPGREPK